MEPQNIFRLRASSQHPNFVDPRCPWHELAESGLAVFGFAQGIAAEKQFYRLTQYEPDGHDPLTMEKQLSEMEGEVSLITDQWLEWLPQMKPLDEHGSGYLA